MTNKRISMKRVAKYKREKGHSKTGGKSSKLAKMTLVKRIVGIAVVFFILMILVGGIGVAALVAKYSSELPPAGQPFQKNAAEATQIFDRNGKVLYSLHGEQNREWVPLKDVSPNMKWAMISAEDANFYNEQIGIDPLHIAGAAVYDVLHRGSGSLAGGSGITQQLVKNTMLTDKQSYGRKIKELILTLQISRTYSKDQVLEAYLNEIPFGGDVYGIKTASEMYFGVEPNQLDLAQSAMLAGIVQAPSYYSPIFGTNPDAATYRQHYVLNEMLKYKDETGVTQKQADNAMKEVLHYQSLNQDILAPHFVNYVIQQLDDKYGTSYAENQGLQVYTTLDYNIQQLAEQTVTNTVDFYSSHKLNGHNGGLITIDATNGEIMAMVGSYKYGANLGPQMQGDANVTLLPRQPGSSIKPILYATAFQDLGMNPATLMPDLPINIGGYQPTNWDNSYQGPENIRKALQGSRNVPAVKTLYALGTSSFIGELDKLGYTGVDNYQNDLSIAIGSASVPLLEHTAAYASLADEGTYFPPVSILKIVDKDGKVLYQYDPTTVGQQVMQPKYPYMVTNVLEGYSTLSANPSIKGQGFHVAAKTGTTNGARDALLMGYTPKFATGIWIGNSDNSIMTPVSWGEYIAPFWNKYMIQINQPYKSMDFAKPAGVVNEVVCANDGLLAKPSDACQKTTDIFSSDQLPKYDDENIAVKVCNEDPSSLATQDQVNSGDYTTKVFIQLKEWSSIFQPALQDWEQKIGYPYTPPPTQYCNNTSNKTSSGISISVSPSSGQYSPGQSIQISVNPGTLTLQNVSYQFNGSGIGNGSGSPNFPVNYTIPSNTNNGTYTITATATDNTGNNVTTSTQIQVGNSSNSQSNGTVNLISPPNTNQTYNKITNPTLSLHATYSGDLSPVKDEYFLIHGGVCDQGGGCSTDKIKPANDFSYSWPIAGVPNGSYSVTAIVEMQGGTQVQSNSNSFTISTGP